MVGETDTTPDLESQEVEVSPEVSQTVAVKLVDIVELLISEGMTPEQAAEYVKNSAAKLHNLAMTDEIQSREGEI